MRQAFLDWIDMNGSLLLYRRVCRVRQDNLKPLGKISTASPPVLHISAVEYNQQVKKTKRSGETTKTKTYEQTKGDSHE